MERLKNYIRASEISNPKLFVQELLADPSQERKDVLDFAIFTENQIVKFLRFQKQHAANIERITNDGFTRKYLDFQVNDNPIGSSNLTPSQQWFLQRRTTQPFIPDITLKKVMNCGNEMTIAELIVKFRQQILALSDTQAIATPGSSEEKMYYPILEAGYLESENIGKYTISADPNKVFSILSEVMSHEEAQVYIQKLNFRQGLMLFEPDIDQYLQQFWQNLVQGDKVFLFRLEALVRQPEQLSEFSLTYLVRILSTMCPIERESYVYDFQDQALSPVPLFSGMQGAKEFLLNMLQRIFIHERCTQQLVSQCSPQLLMYIVQLRFPQLDIASIMLQRTLQEGFSFLFACTACLVANVGNYSFEVTCEVYDFITAVCDLISRHPTLFSITEEAVRKKIETLERAVYDVSNLTINSLHQKLKQCGGKACDCQAAQDMADFLTNFGFDIDYAVRLLGNAFRVPEQLECNQTALQIIAHRFANETRESVKTRLGAFLVALMHRFNVLFATFSYRTSNQLSTRVGLVVGIWNDLLAGFETQFCMISATIDALEREQNELQSFLRIPELQKYQKLKQDLQIELIQSERQNSLAQALETKGQLTDQLKNVESQISERQRKEEECKSAYQEVVCRITSTRAALRIAQTQLLELLDCKYIKAKPFLYASFSRLLTRFDVAIYTMPRAEPLTFDFQWQSVYFNTEDRLTTVLNQILHKNAAAQGSAFAQQCTGCEECIVRYLGLNMLFNQVNSEYWLFLEGLTGKSASQLAEWMIFLLVLPLVDTVFGANLQTIESSDLACNLSINASSLCNIAPDAFAELAQFVIARLSKTSIVWAPLQRKLVKYACYLADHFDGKYFNVFVRFCRVLAEKNLAASAMLSGLFSVLWFFFQAGELPETQSQLVELDLELCKAQEVCFWQLPRDVQATLLRLYPQRYQDDFQQLVAVQLRELCGRYSQFVEESNRALVHHFFAQFCGTFPASAKDSAARLLGCTLFSECFNAAHVLKQLCAFARDQARPARQQITNAVHQYLQEVLKDCAEACSIADFKACEADQASGQL